MKKEKRPATDKQAAYLEFKETEGKKIEESIVMSRDDMRQKRLQTKDLTQHINAVKRSMDTLNNKLEKKEEERKMQSKALRNEMGFDAFDGDDVHQEDIIDEEELVMLKEIKDLKRNYRDNFSKLKGLKQELVSLQNNIDTSKEQLIYHFENWYADTFEPQPIGVNQPIDNTSFERQLETRGESGTGVGSSHMSTRAERLEKGEEAFEDEDAAVYRRAKFAVEELHRARKFEKSIKLK